MRSADPSDSGARPSRTLFGRRKGRALKPLQESAFQRLLPVLSVPVGGAAALDPSGLFETRPADVWLEIGFGAGEHLLAQAASHADVGFIGCEPFREGMGKLVRAVEDQAATNIRVHAGDARDLIATLADGSIGRVFVLFPDPWPKTRHHKRRFIGPETLDGLARVMRPGAELRVASDWPDYVRWTLYHGLRHTAFDWPAVGPADWRVRPADAIETRYARKARAAGRRSFYLRFLRR